MLGEARVQDFFGSVLKARMIGNKLLRKRKTPAPHESSLKCVLQLLASFGIKASGRNKASDRVGGEMKREMLYRYSGIPLYVRQHKIYMDDSECKLNIDDVQLSVITSIFPAVSIEKRNDLQQVHSLHSRWSQYQSSAAESPLNRWKTVQVSSASTRMRH